MPDITRWHHINWIEADLLAEIDQQCFPVQYQFPAEQFWLLSRLSSYLWLAWIDDNPNRDYPSDKHIAGYALALRLDSQEVYLSSIAVLPQYRGTGIGHLLLNEFLLAVKKDGAKKTYLRCAPELVAFYKKYGFVVERTLTDKRLWMYQQSV